MEDEQKIAYEHKMPSFIASFDEGGEKIAVEILRRNSGTTCKSQSHSLNNSAVQYRVEDQDGEEEDEGVISDQWPAPRRCEKSYQETSEEEGEENEATEQHSSGLSGEIKTLDICQVDTLNSPGECCCSGDGNETPADDSVRVKEHVYCTVYCIANDTLGKGVEFPAGPTETATVVIYGSPERDVETSPDTASSPGVYGLGDLVPPPALCSLSRQQSGVSTGLSSCRVCLEDKPIAPLHCCLKAVCDECLKLYISSQVRLGRAYIICPIPECSGFLEEGVVISNLANEEIGRYHYFLELSQLDATTKPCPQCSLFTSLKTHIPNRAEHKYKIQCSKCQFVWCFKCHAPWHNGLKCRDYRRGDKLLRNWASVIEHGQRNAQKCPQCKIHIQRTEGCDHMTCTQCNTNFCYRCGERYRHLRFFGDHTSNLSVFGCRYRYLPDRPHLRRLIRGSVCVSKVVIAPLVIVLVVVLGALSLVIGLIVFPVYYACKRKKKQHSQGSGRWS
ncbi:probable E3 ubiquitin-protein ligase RNF217 [Lampris incognitus]|uniref:probable E3 ubiquitin-protein ligase RNF217 n=1 Tax=Lampris incognitus TaxID=2546036 RepID=UPI0024B5F83B|nr:probable E3 ubiquitin-protein ligase RNF217 [Lampris incognitus]